MKSTVFVLASLAAALTALPVHATWSYTQGSSGLPSGKSLPSDCNGYITDGNWYLGVSKFGDGNWRLGKNADNKNGTIYIAGTGDLDLRDVTTDCGVVLKDSNNGALENCAVITSCIFPDSLERMRGNTFKKCSALTNVVFGSGLKQIDSADQQSFLDCTSLKSVTFNDGIERIGNRSFSGCSALELDDYTFPASLTNLGNHAFTGCKKLTGTITFPGLRTVSADYTFEDCIAMTNFVAPNLVNSVKGMFNRCAALKSATFSQDIESFGEASFAPNNGGPVFVSFYPTNNMTKLTTIGQQAFKGQKELEIDALDFSKSKFTELPYQAFVDSSTPLVLKFPEGLTTIGNDAFFGGKAPHVIWFYGAPPTSVGTRAFNPNGGTDKTWVIVAGAKHAAEWEADARVDKSLTDADRTSAATAIENFGLTGKVKLIGKWTTEAGDKTHWVVEELPKGLTIFIQ